MDNEQIEKLSELLEKLDPDNQIFNEAKKLIDDYMTDYMKEQINSNLKKEKGIKK